MKKAKSKSLNKNEKRILEADQTIRLDAMELALGRVIGSTFREVYKETLGNCLRKKQDKKIPNGELKLGLPKAVISTLDMEQKIRLMELAHKETPRTLDPEPSWQDTYKRMVELITCAPVVDLSGDVLDILKKIDVGEYHLSITPMSDIHILSPEESDDLQKQMNKETVNLDKKLFEMLYLGAISLKMYIDMAPTPVLSHVDKKTPVEELPDYKYATETIGIIRTNFFNR
jgi:hypothetical protein